MAEDVFALTFKFDKDLYTQGDLMTLTGEGTVTSGAGSQPIPATVNVKAADGSTTSLSIASALVTAGEDETWAIDSVTDISGRVWTISADGHSATATA